MPTLRFKMWTAKIQLILLFHHLSENFLSEKSSKSLFQNKRIRNFKINRRAKLTDKFKIDAIFELILIFSLSCSSPTISIFTIMD